MVDGRAGPIKFLFPFGLEKDIIKIDRRHINNQNTIRFWNQINPIDWWSKVWGLEQLERKRKTTAKEIWNMPNKQIVSLQLVHFGDIKSMIDLHSKHFWHAFMSSLWKLAFFFWWFGKINSIRVWFSVPSSSFAFWLYSFSCMSFSLILGSTAG